MGVEKGKRNPVSICLKSEVTLPGVAPTELRGLAGFTLCRRFALHSVILIVMCWWDLQTLHQNDSGGEMVGLNMLCLHHSAQHIAWLTETQSGPVRSLPSGQERGSPPSRLQKAISPRDTKSKVPSVQSRERKGTGTFTLFLHLRQSELGLIQHEVSTTQEIKGIWTSLILIN